VVKRLYLLMSAICRRWTSIGSADQNDSVCRTCIFWSLRSIQLERCFKTSTHIFYLYPETPSKKITSRFTIIPNAFEVFILRPQRYVNYLLTCILFSSVHVIKFGGFFSSTLCAIYVPKYMYSCLLVVVRRCRR